MEFKTKTLFATATLLFALNVPAYAENKDAPVECMNPASENRFDACDHVIRHANEYDGRLVEAAYVERGKFLCQKGKSERALADFRTVAGSMQDLMVNGPLKELELYDGPVDGKINDKFLDALDKLVRSKCKTP